MFAAFAHRSAYDRLSRVWRTPTWSLWEIAEAVGQLPTNTALDYLSMESPTPVDGIAFSGLCHGKLRAKVPGYHNLPLMHQNQPQTSLSMAHSWHTQSGLDTFLAQPRGAAAA